MVSGLFELTVAAVLLAPTAAFADAGPKVATRVTAKGEVVAEVKVAAKPDAVRALLSGAEKAHSFAPTTVSAKATPDGKCEKVALQTRGLLSPFVLETRRCRLTHRYVNYEAEPPNGRIFEADEKLVDKLVTSHTILATPVVPGWMIARSCAASCSCSTPAFNGSSCPKSWVSARA